MKHLNYIINIAGALAAIAIILYFVDVGQIWGVISHSRLEFILLASLAYITLNAAMAQRIRVLLSSMGHRIPFASALKADLGGMLASDFSPARSGYFLTAFLISSEKSVNLEKSMLAIFGPQLLEFLLKAVCTALLVVLIMQSFPIFAGKEILVFATLAAIAGGIIFFFALLFHPNLLERFAFMKIGPGKKVFYLFHLMRDNSGVMVREWPSILSLTMIAYILKAVEWFLLAKALGITVIGPVWDLGFFLLFVPFVTFVQFLPLPTIAGAGTGEAAGTAILALFGVPIEIGISFGFLTRGMMILVDLAGISAILPFIRKESFDGVLKDIDAIEERMKD